MNGDWVLLLNPEDASFDCEFSRIDPFSKERIYLVFDSLQEVKNEAMFYDLYYRVKGVN